LLAKPDRERLNQIETTRNLPASVQPDEDGVGHHLQDERAIATMRVEAGGSTDRTIESSPRQPESRHRHLLAAPTIRCG
jgi:hypothetical protein